MAAADQIMDNLRTLIPGATDDPIKLQLWNALDEFCRTTKVWSSVIELTVTPGDTSYNLSVDDAIILEVVSVAHAQMGLRDAIYDGAGNIDLGEVPAASHVGDPVFITVALTVSGSYTEDVADWAPDEFFTNHMHALIDGTAGRMMGQIAKPWSSPTMALYHMRRFRNAMAGARTYVLQGGVPDAYAWRFPRWA